MDKERGERKEIKEEEDDRKREEEGCQHLE
jgi:hypothetical protein